MKKPRPYDGPVGWLDRARAYAESWPSSTRAAVEAANPYPPSSGVRPMDWLELVAHVSARRQEKPIATAERLALYVTTYRERYRGEAPEPVHLKETHA